MFAADGKWKKKLITRRRRRRRRLPLFFFPKKKMLKKVAMSARAFVARNGIGESKEKKNIYINKTNDTLVAMGGPGLPEFRSKSFFNFFFPQKFIVAAFGVKKKYRLSPRVQLLRI